MPRMTDFQAACIHEAAHGVLAMSVGISVRSLEVYSADGMRWGGSVQWQAPPSTLVLDMSYALLAGEVAAYTMSMLPIDLRSIEASSDIRGIARLMEVDTPSMTHLQALAALERHPDFAPLLSRVIEDVSTERAGISRVATLLSIRGRLTGVEVQDAWLGC